MVRAYRIAISAAVAFSALSVYDALHHGFTGRPSAFSDPNGTTGWTLATSALSVGTFAALGAVLVSTRHEIDHGRKARTWVRRLLTIDLAVLAAVFAFGAPFLSEPDSAIGAGLAPVAGSSFAAMFLLAFVLGLSILRRRALRVSAVLLTAVVPVIGLTLALPSLAPGFEHPAYAETAVYLGLALLGRPKPAAPRHPLDGATVGARRRHPRVRSVNP